MIFFRENLGLCYRRFNNFDRGAHNIKTTYYVLTKLSHNDVAYKITFFFLSGLFIPFFNLLEFKK